MSHVTKIKTQYTDPKHLEAALREVFGECERNATLQAYYQNQNQQVQFRVRKDALAKHTKTGRAYADLGFRKAEGGGFELVADDSDVPYLTAALGRLTQRYGLNVSKQKARELGYVPMETLDAKTGAIRLRLTR